MRLRLFLDSADPEQWARWLPLGLFHGVTTNPTLLRRAGQPCTTAGLARLSERALALGCREVHLQTWGDSAQALQQRGEELAALAPGRVVVKVPVNEAGSQAALALIETGAAVTFTACYEVPQVLVAAALNAAYIAPYLGRINDLGRDGEAELIAMQHCLNGCAGGTRLLVASLRDAAELGRLAAAGLDTFTISPAIAAGLFASEATAAAAAAFERDAAAAG